MYYDSFGNVSIPASFAQMTLFSSSYSPSSVHVKNNALHSFFAGLLFEKAISVFKWKLPENWSEDYFLDVLYSWGYIGVLETDKYGVICQHGTRYGYDLYWQPTHLIVTNPLLKGTLNPKIGTSCSVIKLRPNWYGALDLINYYADKMSLASESVDINLLNSHLVTIFPAESENMAQSYKKLYDGVSRGEPCIVIDKSLFKEDGSIAWDVFQQNLKENYIVSDLLTDLRKIENEFNTRIGIDNSNTEKKERMIKDEVNANNEETKSLAELWFDTIQKGIKQTKELFPDLDLTMEWRNKPKKEGGSDNGNTGDADNSGTL